MKALCCSLLCCFALWGGVRSLALDETTPIYSSASGSQSSGAAPTPGTASTTPSATASDGTTTAPDPTRKKHHKHKKVVETDATTVAKTTAEAASITGTPAAITPKAKTTGSTTTAAAKAAAKKGSKASKTSLAQKAAKKATAPLAKAGGSLAATSGHSPQVSIQTAVTERATTGPASPAGTADGMAPAPAPAPALATIDISPVVETGLPVARPGATTVTYPGSGAGRSNQPVNNAFLTGLPPSALPAAAPGLFNASSYAHHSVPDPFVFADFSRRHTSYPWHKDVMTTIFWIGEGASGYNSTTNRDSSWEEGWTRHNRGVDTPNDRAAYSPGSHLFTINTFYVALPFNDLAFPDKSRRWLPGTWYRAPQNGHAVSACKDRWVRIKNRQGDYCYAQWEDVGPFDVDHAEYVFGSERPNTPTGAGLDISPAVAQYLNIDGNNRYTSWSFVDEIDVPHGPWLTYDELAVMAGAILQLKDKPHPLPVQKTEAPLPDQTTLESSLKKVGAAKG